MAYVFTCILAPQTDDAHLTEVPDRPTPANKKNRVKLDPTAEEDETPPSSPKPSAELSTSPPHETKVRQISRRVRGMKWEDRPPFEIPQEVGTAGVSSVVVVEGQQQLAPAASISSSSGSTSPNTPQDPSKQNEVQQEISTQDDTNGDAEVPAAQEGSPPESDSEDQDKSLKRKLGDPVQASAVDRLSSTSGVEPAKRARDDAEEDDNPREKKRPSPPPDEEAKADAPQPAAPQAKVVSPARSHYPQGCSTLTTTSTQREGSLRTRLLRHRLRGLKARPSSAISRLPHHRHLQRLPQRPP